MNNKTKNKISDTNDYSFSDICHNYKKFLIPPFQRAYTWKPKQIDTLWQDMLANDKGYFIGSIVLLEAVKKNENRVVVIDGQQRLFTISLMILALNNKWLDEIKT